MTEKVLNHDRLKTFLNHVLVSFYEPELMRAKFSYFISTNIRETHDQIFLGGFLISLFLHFDIKATEPVSHKIYSRILK